MRDIYFKQFFPHWLQKSFAWITILMSTACADMVMFQSGLLFTDPRTLCPNETDYCQCDRAVFDHPFWSDNIITEYNLICEREHLAAMSDKFFYLGKLASGLIGLFMDAYTRKWTWILTQFLCLLFTGLQSTATTVELYSIYRLLQGIFNGLWYQTLYVYVTELIAPSDRSSQIPFIDMMVGVGGCLLALIAFQTETWREYTNVLCYMTAVSTFLVLFLPESNMWLQTKHEQRVQSRGYWQIIKEFVSSIELVKTTLMLSFLFSSSQMTLFGLTLSADSVYGNVLINFTILGVVDAIANIILSILTKWCSRRMLNVASFAALGTCCLAVGFIRLFGATDYAVLAGLF